MTYILGILPIWVLPMLFIALIVWCLHLVNQSCTRKEQEDKAFEDSIKAAFQLQERDRLKKMFQNNEDNRPTEVDYWDSDSSWSE